MSITVNIRYTAEGDNARKFAEEMMQSGIVEFIRNEPGNLKYEYFIPLDDPHTVLLIDQWENQEAIDIHHDSPMMGRIAELRDKYDLHMQVERFRSDDSMTEKDKSFIRK